MVNFANPVRAAVCFSAVCRLTRAVNAPGPTRHQLGVPQEVRFRRCLRRVHQLTDCFFVGMSFPSSPAVSPARRTCKRSAARSAQPSCLRRWTRSFCAAPTRCCPRTCRQRCVVLVSFAAASVAHLSILISAGDPDCVLPADSDAGVSLRCVALDSLTDASAIVLLGAQECIYEHFLQSKEAKRVLNGKQSKVLPAINGVQPAFFARR